MPGNLLCRISGMVRGRKRRSMKPVAEPCATRLRTGGNPWTREESKRGGPPKDQNHCLNAPNQTHPQPPQTKWKVAWTQVAWCYLSWWTEIGEDSKVHLRHLAGPLEARKEITECNFRGWELGVRAQHENEARPRWRLPVNEHVNHERRCMNELKRN